MFENVLNWKLLNGSHEFPGPDGGTCINEAAIIAAGFKYRPVNSVGSCPPCFSPVVAQFALVLNDMMSEPARNKLLMPFVTRLAGTRDKPEIELKRLDYLLERTPQFNVPKPIIAFDVVNDICALVPANPYFEDAFHVRKAIRLNYYDFEELLVKAVNYAAGCFGHGYWSEAVDALDHIILMGNHADDVDMALIQERMDEARGNSANHVVPGAVLYSEDALNDG